ncbi:hypothetical protein BD779DRAFT_1674992 [Infundibulicybe gibba]|nr:hypothetical protein BD779DRAFT_1674992 [Infundibulicybe gibba]
MIPFVFSIAVALEAIVHCTVQGAYIFLELGMGLAWTGRVAIPSTTVLQVDARDQQTRWIITSFFTISAFVDVFITASVSYQLRRRRTNSLKRTKYLIDKVIQWTIPTGMLTSAVAIAIVLVWNIQRDSFLWVGICAFESDFYAAGLLALLNARRTRFNTTEPDHLSISMSRYPETLTSSDVARITATAVSGPSTSSLDHPKGQDGSQDVVVYKLENDPGDMVPDLYLLLGPWTGY